jgi:hypothetical protein
MSNRIIVQFVTAGEALDVGGAFFGDRSEAVMHLAPQLAVASRLRVITVNGYPVMLGGLHDLPDGTKEAFVIVRPDWTPTARLMLPIMRRLRVEADMIARDHVFVAAIRSDAGRRMAEILQLRFLRKMRHAIGVLEIWGRVLPQETGSSCDRRAIGAEAGCSGG